MKLFTIGPVEMYPSTKAVRQNPFVYFRTNEFSEIVKDALKRLGFMLGNDEEDSLIYMAGSGTAAMEASVENCVSDKDKVLVINGGSFGKRFCELLEFHGKKYKSVDLAWNETLTQKHLEPYENKNFTMLFVNLHETHTGQLYDAKMLGGFCQRNNMLFVIDAIGTFLADEYDMKKIGADLTIISSQKGLCLSPGMAIISFSKRMIDKIYSIQKPASKYFDFKDYLSDIKRGQTPYTPPVLVMYELQDMLNLIDKQGGLKARLDEVKEKCEYFRQKARDFGLIIPNYPLSNALTPLYFEDLNAYEVIQTLKNKYRIFVNPCGGDLADKLLRVTHIGNTTLKDIDDLLEKLMLSIKEVKNDRK